MIILDIICCTPLFTLAIQSVCASFEVAVKPWRSCSLLASALVQVVVLTEVSTMYIYLDVFRWTLYRTPVGSLENAVLCCALFTEPYQSNDDSLHPEGPATGQLDQGFSWISLVLEQMLSWYPKLHVVLHASHAALQMIR
jgi:hypothetical protein